MNQFLIVCPLLFLAGFLDAIGSGGGLISLPASLLAGLPVHSAIATNKLSGSCGTALATFQFIRRGLVQWKLAIPTVVAAIMGSAWGAQTSMAVEEAVKRGPTITKPVILIALGLLALKLLGFL